MPSKKASKAKSRYLGGCLFAYNLDFGDEDDQGTGDLEIGADRVSQGVWSKVVAEDERTFA